MQQNDFEPALMDPAAFGAFIRSEIATWAKVVKAAGIKAD
jgi:tripartite-type tricarboxylate transporter receptor subunit TctC